MVNIKFNIIIVNDASLLCLNMNSKVNYSNLFLGKELIGILS